MMDFSGQPVNGRSFLYHSEAFKVGKNVLYCFKIRGKALSACCFQIGNNSSVFFRMPESDFVCHDRLLIIVDFFDQK